MKQQRFELDEMLRPKFGTPLTLDVAQYVDVGPEQANCIPRGAIHRFDNSGSRDAKVLCVVTPAALGPEYFREAFALINAAAGGPPDRAKMAEIMRRYGLTPAAPRHRLSTV